jgi:hypothetical protein
MRSIGKNKKRQAAMIAAVTVVLSLSACGGSSSDSDSGKTAATKKSAESAVTTQSADSAESDETSVTDESYDDTSSQDSQSDESSSESDSEDTSDVSSQTQSAAEVAGTAIADNGGVIDFDFTTISIDGVDYTIGETTLQQIFDAGNLLTGDSDWIDWYRDVILTDEYAGVTLTNSNYSYGNSLTISIVPTSEDTLYIDSVLGNISLDVSQAMPNNVDYPKVQLPNGITFGSTKGEILQAYGTPLSGESAEQAEEVANNSASAAVSGESISAEEYEKLYGDRADSVDGNNVYYKTDKYTIEFEVNEEYGLCAFSVIRSNEQQ